NGGTVNVTAQNDGIKADPEADDTESAGTVTINGGTINVDAGDDAIKAAYVLTIGTKGASTGPKINVKSCVEGLEGAEIYLNSGSGSITASDDGINAANSGLTNYSFLLDIEGGTWIINSGGDGVDSNKDIVVNGGTTIVYGPTNNGNAALDYEGSCTVNSGELLCIGTSGMAMAPSSGTYVMFGSGGMGGGRMGQRPGQNGQAGTASQGSVSISAGSIITIKDASGNTLIETTSPKAANNVMFASDSLSSGSSYTLYVNGTQAATASAAAGNGQSGGQPGGQGMQPGENGEMPTPPDGTQPPDGTAPTPPDGTQPTPPDQSGTSVAGFTDVKSTDWFAKAVQYVSTSKYMNGTSATTFEPNTNLTRAMMVQILYNMEGKPSVSETSSYTDVKDTDWYADAVAWAEDNDLVQGYGSGVFGGLDSLTREQAATILKRYEEYKGGDVSASADLSAYTDANRVSDWAEDAMKWAVGAKIINGTSATTLEPAGTATRAQMAQILMNMK
ncbi:MAG: S-layer homology domain-containing protein, partial [Firmicutes bacterium]|nr:S-layer homology domain-containing protein [Bacillota bacterium]